MTEKIHYFFATDLVQGPVHPDDGEFLDVVRLPLAELEELARKGEIKDGKTLIGLFKAQMLMKERGI
jgi:ADP-ribose pyrophosphatase